MSYRVDPPDVAATRVALLTALVDGDLVRTDDRFGELEIRRPSQISDTPVSHRLIRCFRSPSEVLVSAERTGQRTMIGGSRKPDER